MLKVFHALIETAKDGVLTFEWIFAKEELKDGSLIVLADLPVGVGHGELVQVGEQCSHQVVAGCGKKRGIVWGGHDGRVDAMLWRSLDAT
jgi:hypothetical protein